VFSFALIRSSYVSVPFFCPVSWFCVLVGPKTYEAANCIAQSDVSSERDLNRTAESDQETVAFIGFVSQSQHGYYCVYDITIAAIRWAGKCRRCRFDG